jgi:hypothetical protein
MACRIAEEISSASSLEQLSQSYRGQANCLAHELDRLAM